MNWLAINITYLTARFRGKNTAAPLALRKLFVSLLQIYTLDNYHTFKIIR